MIIANIEQPLKGIDTKIKKIWKKGIEEKEVRFKWKKKKVD